MADLLERIAENRDPQAFRELFRTYGPRVKALLMRLGADAEIAEDITQETLLTVWRKANLFSAEKGSLSTWVHTIARNLWIDRMRREAIWENLPDEIELIPSGAEEPEIALTREQERNRLRAALANLPPEQKEVIRLAYIDGLSQSQIAERLRLPLGTVKSRLRLAFAKIREAMGERR